MAPTGSEAAARLKRAMARLTELTSGRPPTGRTHQQADPDPGSVATDDAVGFDPLPVLAALAECSSERRPRRVTAARLASRGAST